MSKLHGQQLTVRNQQPTQTSINSQYQQATQTAVNCTISASYTDSNELYIISNLQRQQLTAQYQQPHTNN